VTGEGLQPALAGADIVVDVSNSPSFEDKAVLHFFETGTRNLIAAAKQAGVRRDRGFRAQGWCGPRLQPVDAAVAFRRVSTIGRAGRCRA
jgi:hypothetical protein